MSEKTTDPKKQQARKNNRPEITGPKSGEAVRLVRQLGISVRGNHDDSCIAAYYGLGKYADPVKRANYKYTSTLNQLTEADVDWFARKCPIMVNII